MFSTKNFRLKMAFVVATAALLGQGRAALAAAGEMSFTPTGMKLPIKKISIAMSDGTNEQNLYSCTTGDCLVDLTQQSALNAIAASAAAVTIRNGTYNTLNLNTCDAGTSGSTPTTAYVKGSFTAGGTAYVTDPDATNLSGVKTSGTADFTVVGNWACSTRVVKMTPPLVIAAGTATNLTVLVDNALAAYSSGTQSPGQGGCKAPAGGASRGICLTYPVLVPVLGTGTPTTQRYKLAHNNASAGAINDAKANAVVIVALDSSNVPLIAYGRTIFTETSAAQSTNTSGPTDPTFGGPSFVTDTDVSTFAVNADGSIKFQMGGSLDNYSAGFAAFRLLDHNGTDTTKSGVPWFYHAIPF